MLDYDALGMRPFHYSTSPTVLPLVTIFQLLIGTVGTSLSIFSLVAVSIQVLISFGRHYLSMNDFGWHSSTLGGTCF